MQEAALASCKEFLLREAATILKNDIIEMIEGSADLPWPPTADSLSWENRQPPESIKRFLRTVIHETHHEAGNETQRYVDSISQDLVHAVSKGNFLTEKHVLLATGLHSITGLKVPIKILARLGHCCSYHKVRLIETAQAELIRQLRSLENPLPILPANELDRVLKFFWWDNFDVRKENIQGSLHTTHGVAFQEMLQSNLDRNTDIEIPNSKKKSITYQPPHLSQRKIVPHKNPQLFDAAANPEYNGRFADDVILLWTTKRRILSKSPQSVSRFVGWVVKSFGVRDSNPTNITFLPPTFNPITEYSTVLECIKQSQGLASVSQMKYTHITVDAGAAQKFFHVNWNNPEEFRNVIIHLGDFHSMMGFFGNIGRLVSGSGFEDVVYQSNLCTSGGITSVISGKHYNRSWDIHECFAEAVDRFFCEEYLPEISQELQEMIRCDGDATRVLKDNAFKSYTKQYNSFQERCIQGEFGKTPTPWMFYKICVNEIPRRYNLIYVTCDT